MRESAIQTKIKKKLENSGWFVVKIITCSKPGWPDLQAHRAGVTAFVEVKREGKAPTDLQLYIHDLLKKQGFEVISCATSIDDIKHLL